MAVVGKITEEKLTPRKKVINVKNVHISNGMMVDEDGVDVVSAIEKEIPDGVEEFSFKISIELFD